MYRQPSTMLSLLSHLRATGRRPAQRGCCSRVIMGHCKAIICGLCQDLKVHESQQGWLSCSTPGSVFAFVCRDRLSLLLSFPFFCFLPPPLLFLLSPSFFCLKGFPSSPSSQQLMDSQNEWECDHCFPLSLRLCGERRLPLGLL